MSGTCGVCGRYFALLRADGRLNGHFNDSAVCPGSKTLPAERSPDHQVTETPADEVVTAAATHDSVDQAGPVIGDTGPADLRTVLARTFHDAYEAAAAHHGWSTQESCRVEFDDLPIANRATMLAAVDAVLAGPELQWLRRHVQANLPMFVHPDAPRAAVEWVLS
jgi:hypothetical protein